MNTWSTTMRAAGMAAWIAFAVPAIAQDAPAPAEPASAEPAPAEPAPAEPTAPAEPAPAAPASAEPASAQPVAGEPAPAAPPTAPILAPAATEAPAPPRITVALPPPPSVADDLPIPTLTIDRIPPSTSFEFAVQVSYGTVAYFRDQVPPWVGFGVRGGWGKNFGVHRIGVGATLAAEGDIGVHTQLSLEPTLTWDLVTRQGLLLGLGAGPAGVFTSRTSTVITEVGVDVAPTAAARIGWSQTWSRVGRRLFVFAEPKVRMAEGRLSPLVAVAVGSGGGR